MDMNTGYDLKAWRKANHMTQKELGDKISYSTSRISHIEYGNVNLSKRLIHQVHKLDMLLNPPTKKVPIAEAWDNIKYYSNIYGTELSVIETGIINLLTINVNKMGFDNTEAYLKFIGSSLLKLNNINVVPFQNTKDGKESARNLFTDMYREAIIYLRKIHS